MSKIVLVALNSSFSHTNLALRYVREKLADLTFLDSEIILFERTINDQWLNLFDQLLSFDADIYAFSCYIWNRTLVESLSKHLKQIKPDAAIIWGGPDVSSQAELMLKKHPWLDGLIQSEGDSASIDWIIRYLGYDNFVPERRIGESEELNWQFPYTESEMKEYNNRILYYEGSRGCAYNCSYCLSSNTFKVRHKPLKEVLSELDWILQFNPRQLKFIDRTFNSDPLRAFQIWHFLIERSNQLKTRTNFHFEIAAELLNQKQIDLLKTAKAGLFQFEIGAQTTNSEVLKIIGRPYQPEFYNNAVKQLRSMENIHLHLDLIAGLPGESLESQINSANELLQLYPNMLQMGFLKVLPNTKMKFDCDQREMIYQDFPPYEILESDHMTANELMYYRKLEKIVETFYNSGHYFYSLNFLLGFSKKPFSIFISLNDFLEAELKQGALSVNRQVELFHQFGLVFIDSQIDDLSIKTEMKFWLEDVSYTKTIFTDLLKLDYFLQGKRGFPNWFSSLQQDSDSYKKTAYRKSLELYRQTTYQDRVRFENFRFSLKSLPGLDSKSDLFAGAGEVQPMPDRVLENLIEQAKNLKLTENKFYVCALRLGHGPMKVITEYLI